MKKETWKEVIKEMWEQNRSNSEDVFTLPEFLEIISQELAKQKKEILENIAIGSLDYEELKRTFTKEEIAKQKVRQKYFDEPALKTDIYFFLGTTAEAHRRRFTNPFVIIGVFYPPKKIDDAQKTIQGKFDF